MNEFIELKINKTENEFHQEVRLFKLKNNDIVTIAYNNIYSPFKDSKLNIDLYVIPTLSHGLAITFPYKTKNDYFVITKIIYKSTFHKIFKIFFRKSIDRLQLMYVEVDKNE